MLKRLPQSIQDRTLSNLVAIKEHRVGFLFAGIISSLSLWRIRAVFDLASLNWVAWSFCLLGLMIGCLAFWIGAIYLAQRLAAQATWTQRIMTILGAALGGLLGLLCLTPAGLSRLTLELYADNVWSPKIFTAAWAGAGAGLDWSVPFELPADRPQAASLEISPLGPPEVWLVEATWSDGQPIPFEQFQAEHGWQRQEITWATYQNRPIWVSKYSQSTILRWAGPTSGPLTLLFAKYPEAGEVLIRWNGVEQIVDLRAPALEFKAVTLPLRKPIVWRANLPLEALLADSINLYLEPDPARAYVTTISKIRLKGFFNQPVEATGDQLLELLSVGGGEAALSPAGIQLVPHNPYKPPFVSFTAPFTGNKSQRLIRVIPWLENMLVVLYAAIIGYLLWGLLVKFIWPNGLINLSLLISSLLVAILIGEISLRLYLPSPKRYYLEQPHLHRIYDPDPQITPGISDLSDYRTNSQGFRSDEFSAEAYQILAIGGSTTVETLLDQTETWPQLLQETLNHNNKDLNVWVGNAGRRGRTTRENLLHVKYLLPQYPQVKTIILLLGINDLALRLGQGDNFDPNFWASPTAERDTLYRAFDLRVKQDPFLPYYKQSATWRLVENYFQPTALPSKVIQDVNPDEDARTGLVKARERRQTAPVQNQLPDLTSALEEYERNVNTMIDLAEANRVRVILMTQPTLWRSDLSRTEKDLLWFGWGPNYEYFYSVEALLAGIAQYNARLLAICQQRQVECIDLATLLPKDTTIFYDDVHFNEQGARQVATIVADRLRHHLPF